MMLDNPSGGAHFPFVVIGPTTNDFLETEFYADVV
jgi:hypothetical protein